MFVSGATGSCIATLKNVAVYQGSLNTLIPSPANPNGVKWSFLGTEEGSIEVEIVNYNGTVNLKYAADYEFRSSHLTIKNATTTVEPGHLLSTAGLYTATCDGRRFSFKFIVVRKCNYWTAKANPPQAYDFDIFAFLHHGP